MSNYLEGSKVAGRFVILERVGQGGMGSVYRALQTSLDREVALKLLHSEVAFTARARRRFGREARAVARLNHPHIAAVFDFGTDNDEQTLWLAMELVKGSSMSQMKRESIDVLRLMSVTDQVLSALSAAHARGIIHRDLKPSNVLTTRDDEDREVIKLVDFGLAATQDGELDLRDAPGGIDAESEAERSRVILGTPRYMAPEIFQRKPIDTRVDLYALGVILYEILAGAPPYPGNDPRELMRAHLYEPIPRLEVRDGGTIPGDLERLVYRLLAKDPAERFGAAVEVREALQGVISEFSYVPWMVMGPSLGDPLSNSRSGNLSNSGFLSGYGSQTMPPTAMGKYDSRMGQAGGQLAPLVGLSDERRRAERHIRRAVKEQKGSLLLFEGAAGMGKSRLIDWLSVRVEESGVMKVVRGSHSKSSGRFSGVRAVLDDIFGTRDIAYSDVPGVVRRQLGEWGFSATEVEITVELMQPGGEEAVLSWGELSAEKQSHRRERVFATVERVLRSAAAERPLMVVLEDLHHASAPTAEFLEHLALGLQLNPMSLVVVGSVRSGEVRGEDAMGGVLERLGRFESEDVARVKMPRLSDEEIESLISKLAPVTEAVIDAITFRASGNPLHATEILRYLQDSGKLVYDNGELRLAGGVDIDGEIPGEVVDLMRYRARQMVERAEEPEAMQAVLERAALLGHRFDYRLLVGMVAREAGQPWSGKVDGVLEALVCDGVLREVGHSGEDLLEFDHVLFRDVLLADMNESRSVKALHKLAAESKIEFFGDRVDSKAVEVVEHYRLAREPRGVYIYTLKAARAAANASDLKQAMKLYREAEELAETAHTESRPDEFLAEASYVLDSEEVALEVAHLERRVGEYASAREHYRELVSSQTPVVSLWAHWGLGKLAANQSALEDARGWFEATRERAKAVAARGEGRVADIVDAHALFGLGRLAMRASSVKAARAFFGRAETKAEAHGQVELQARLAAERCLMALRSGDLKGAASYQRQAMVLAKGLADAEVMAEVQTRLATYLVACGRVGDALDSLKEAKAVFKQLGASHPEARCRLQLGELCWQIGAFKDAARMLRRAHKALQRMGDRHGMMRAKLGLASLAMSIGRLKEARAMLVAASEGFNELGDRRRLSRCLLVDGCLEFKLGELKPAMARLRKAQQLFEHLGVPAGAQASRAWQALMLERSRRYERAEPIVGELMATHVDLLATDRLLAMALAELGSSMASRDASEGVRVAAAAESIFRRLGAQPASR